jgi:hypothetical protein
MCLRRQVETLHHAGCDMVSQLSMQAARGDPVEPALATGSPEGGRHLGRALSHPSPTLCTTRQVIEA